MSNLPDIIGRGTHAARPAFGTAGRLYYESDTSTMFRDSGTAWENVEAGGGGSTLALTKLGETLLTSSAATISFTSISGSYRNLLLVLYSRSTQAAVETTVSIRFNGDTAANYFYQIWSAYATGSAGSTANSQTSMLVGQTSGSTAPANHMGAHRLHIPHYANANRHKTVLGQATHAYGTGTMQVDNVAGIWRATAAITQIDLILGSGSFDVDTLCELYAES